MFRPRRLESHADWFDADRIKLYTLSAHDRPVNHDAFAARLAEVKRRKPVAWAGTPAFAIFHDGNAARYLVLAWWSNDNELFTSVSVETETGWVEDPVRFSFCVWDLEIMWHERNYFIEHIYCAAPDMQRYRRERFTAET